MDKYTLGARTVTSSTDIVIEKERGRWILLTGKPHKDQAKRSREDHKNDNIEYQRVYRQSHKKEGAAYQKIYRRVRSKEDVLFRVTSSLRTRTSRAIKQNRFNKKSHLGEYIGCTLLELKTHLEEQFTPGMTWGNYGEWHIDHIVPLDSATTVDGLYTLCHYTNLQPLWAIDNIRKGNKRATK